jgi:outer membrane protein TolC
MNIKKVKTKTTKPFIAIFSIFLWIGFLLGESPAPISLEKAIETGIQQDSRYKNQLLDNSIALVNESKAQFRKFFSLDLSGSYVFKSQQMEITFFPGKIIDAGSKNNYDLKFSLTQPIYTGNILSNSVKLEIEKEALEKHKTELLEIELAGKIKASYFTFRLLEKKKKSLSLLVENLALHLKRIQDLYKEDLVKKSDVLETQIKISEAEMNIEDLNRMLDEERINFKKLCVVGIDDVETSYVESVGSVDDSLSYFKSRHPVLKTVDQTIQTLQMKKKIASGSYRPQISGFAELHYGKPGIDFFKNKWSVYFQGGIGVNFKLFDWNQLKKDHAITDKSIEQFYNRKEEYIADARKLLDQLYSKKGSIERQFELIDKLVNSASEDVKLKEELYKESQVSNIDYLSALLTKERYESMKDEKSVEYQLVKLNINSLIGKYKSSGEEK